MLQIDAMRIAVAADERPGVADAVVKELRARGHESLAHGALADDERDDWAWCVRGGGPRRRRGPRRAGRRLLLDRDGRVDRREQGRRDPRRAVRRRADRRRRAAVERRQRPRAEPARDVARPSSAEILDAWFAAAPSDDADDVANVEHLADISRDRPHTPRAAARPELGGVERWARELAARLPALGDYEVVAAAGRARAPRRPRVGAGACCRSRARRARLLLNPANLAPLAFPRNVVVIHDAAALRHPSGTRRLYARWQRRAAAARSRAARGVVITVSARSRTRELRELLGVDAHVVPGGVDDRFHARRRPRPGARRPRARPPLRAHGGEPHRPQEPRRPSTSRPRDSAAEGIDLVAAGGERPQFRADARRSGPARPLGHVPDAHLPGLYAGASAFVLPSWHEGFGLTVPRGDGLRRARRRRQRRRPARDLRRRRPVRRPGRPRRHRAPGARRDRGRCPRVPRAGAAPRSSPGSAPRASCTPS